MISERISGLRNLTGLANLWNQAIGMAGAILSENEGVASYKHNPSLQNLQLAQQVSRAYIPFNANR